MKSFFLLVVGAVTATAQVPGLTGTILVTNKQFATATAIDVGSNRIIGTVPTGQGPHEITLARNGNVAVVTDYSPGPGISLTVIDVAALKPARTIDMTATPRPHGIKFLPGDSLVAVTSEQSGNVVIVNALTGTVKATIATQGMGSHMVGVTADGAKAYTGNMTSHTVSELDLRTGRFVRSIPVPNTPESIEVTPDGKEVWVGSNSTSKLTVIDVASWTAATAAEGFRWPYRVLFTPDLKTIIVPDMTNEDVRFFDRASRRELGKISLPGAGPQGITTTPDGKYALLSLSKQAKVAIIDIAKREVVGHLDVGGTPDGIVYSARVR